LTRGELVTDCMPLSSLGWRLLGRASLLGRYMRILVVWTGLIENPCPKLAFNVC
jgi:hypothetical protein